MVSRKGHKRETTELVITEYCSDLAHRPVPLRPIPPYQVIVHAPILYPLRINPRGVPAGRLRCTEPFRKSLLESGSRTDRSLKAAIAEMYLQGVSTRRVSKVLEELCGLDITSTQVSRLTADLDTEFTLWRNRPLPEIAHLILDATYIKVRLNGSVRDCAALIAIGVRRNDSKRMILGVSCSLSETEPHWRDFIYSLKQRGIGIPDSVTSDAHEGLKAALRATLNASPWQRCQFHLQQNAQA